MSFTNLLLPHKGSQMYARTASWFLFGITALAILISIFLSPLKVLGILVVCITCYIAFLRPQWLFLFLLWYLPFESFILKFVPDDIYLYSRYYSECIIYLLCAVILWRLITRQQEWHVTSFDLPFVLFIGILIASTILNVNPPLVAILGVRQIIRFILLYFIAVQLVLDRAWIKRLMIGLLVILGIQASLGFGQIFIGERLDTFLLPSERKTFGEIELTQGTDYFWDPGQRVFGTLGRYDRLGTFMVPLLLFLIAYLYELRKSSLWRTRLSLLFIFCLPILVFTYSRASWFAFLLGAIFISFFIHKDKRILTGIGIGIIVLSLYIALSGIVVNQLIDVPSQTIIHRLLEAFSLERWSGEYYGLGRLYWIVQTALVVFPASPLFGHGPGVYGGGAVSALQYTEVYDRLGLPFGVFGTQGMIDNNWMSLLGETGVLGIGLFLWMYLWVLFFLWKNRLKIKDDFLRAFILGTVATMLAIAFFAGLGTYLEVRTVSAYVWAYIGISVGLLTHTNHTKHDTYEHS